MKKVGFLAFALALFAATYTSANNRPPFRPGNACEAQCLVEFRQCQRICSVNPCLIACETVADICLAACGSES